MRVAHVAVPVVEGNDLLVDGRKLAGILAESGADEADWASYLLFDGRFAARLIGIFLGGEFFL